MLQMNHVSKLFNPGTVDEKVALMDVNLHLKPGDFVTVIGSNGAGKSTLMNIISGVLRPDAGRSELTATTSATCPSSAAAAGSAGCSRIRWQARHRI